MKKYNYAILRTPSQSVTNNSAESEVSFNAIIKEHDTLTHFLKNVPIRVHNLATVNNDVIESKLSQLCVTTDKCVILSNFEDSTINNQKIMLTAHLSRFYPLDRIHYIDFPGILSAKDVLIVDNTCFVSISSTTNDEGIKQLSKILTNYDFKVVVINDSQESLQNYLSYLEGNNLLVKEGFTLSPVFKDFNQITVSTTESAAIGAIWINEVIILPNNCLTSKEQLIDLNRYKVLSISVEELNKASILIKDYVILF